MRKLSFGTVIDVLQQCRKDTYSKTDLAMAVINIVIPQNSCKNLKVSDLTGKLNSLYTCNLNLKALFTDGKPLPHCTLNKDIVNQFETKVLCLIDKARYKLAILALCDMIDKDCTLDSKNNGKNISIFETYIGENIQKFLNDKKYVFSDFLLKICLYTINEVNNRACEDWVKQLSKEYNTYDEGFKNYIAGFENSTRKIQVWGTSNEKEKSQNKISQPIDSSAVLTPSKEDTIGGETYEHYRKRTNTLAVRDIGPENQICLCCENWTGNMENALKNNIGSIGICTLKNEKMLSTNSMCKWAIPSMRRANKHRTRY